MNKSFREWVDKFRLNLEATQVNINIDKVMVLDNGEIIDYLTLNELYNKYPDFELKS